MSCTIIPAEDYAWLADTHAVDIKGAEIIILHGNEDCPDKIEVYARDHFEANPIRVYFPQEYPTFYVEVGNIGSVYRGTSLADAESSFNHYLSLSVLGIGRVAGEPVTLFKDDEIVSEHVQVGSAA